MVLTDDLQIHLVELPKSTATIHNLNQVNSLERWAWFLQHSHTLESETLRRLLPEPAFQEAVGVLEMISRDPDRFVRSSQLIGSLDVTNSASKRGANRAARPARVAGWT